MSYVELAECVESHDPDDGTVGAIYQVAERRRNVCNIQEIYLRGLGWRTATRFKIIKAAFIDDKIADQKLAHPALVKCVTLTPAAPEPEDKDAVWLKNLGARLMRIPVMHGTDQGDVDRLNQIAERLKK